MTDTDSTAEPSAPTELDPTQVPDATVRVQSASLWFGQKVALSEVTCSFGPGIAGLLGPNGAGKTTLMRAMVGMMAPNIGHIEVLGRNPRNERKVHSDVALVPEDEAVPEALTARQLVRYTADLHGITDYNNVAKALETVDLLPVADRKLSTFSKGMRQRAKVAAALVHNPSVLILDEPLNGADPVQRLALVDLFKRLGDQGRTLIVSSHVLAEVEMLASRIVVLVHGRIAAAGGQRAIRDAMADRPRRVLVRTDQVRGLAGALIALDAVAGIDIRGNELVISSVRARELAVSLPGLARATGARLLEVRPLDDSLESLFRELVR